ncbi:MULTISPECIES: putative mucin/carbohydrate-binding domain-containing protein [Bacillus cereus group]|uniref:putative mucin/carbohydrate-binding domain-containing protein n=1 Tax=Bacillus cereus group TaxID=86661 RepID=UPI000BF344C8|nr:MULTISPECIES: putative mucin/carbohydrate-binding domain-containing protein [Bacillus cereus group]PFU34635.1 wall-associated protein [Bacillus cereus]MCU5174246.1 M60 family metallopeptidase [Bacillus paranthracis]MCU5201509.1 M60 family metallopeptidase [Bacillus paranthracis]MCU5388932.1 M60 family metallopeptidase [Bacillus paranthracis]MDA1920598.1 M60 family metallopeptidase [Bacillus cereus group sp. BcHK140]
MSKKKKSRVLVAGICLATLLTPYGLELPKVYAEMAVEDKEKQQEERVYQLLPKGDVEGMRELHQRGMSFSPYEPTGIYVKPDEEVVIQVEGTQQIKAYIGTYSYEKEEPKQFNLHPGENKISSSNGGLLYFYNYHNTGEVVAKVKKGGTPNPLFILGKHTTKDWKRMLAENPDPYAIEMKGENSLLTMHPETVAEHLKQEDPAALLKKHDEIINIEHKISGLSKDGAGVANQGKHSIHFVEDWYTDDYMYATYYRTAYSKGNLGSVLNLEELTNDGWGPWHEVGHQHQQETWLWDGLGEVTVNIYSLAVQTTFGHKTRLEQEGRYEAAFAYLGKPDAQEKMNEFEKLVMFWQLHLAYGDQFYPNLHQMYRLLHDTERPKSDEEKKQMFIYMTSKVAGQNLIPFFDKWGLSANDATREKIAKLNLPKLEKEIWLSTDSNPIREKQIELYEAPYGEPNNEKIQNIVIGTTYDEEKAKELVQNLGEGVKTTGVIMQDKPEVGEKTVKVEIVDGKGNKNFIPVVVNVGYGDSLLVYGLNYTWGGDLKSTVTLHHGTKTFSATDTKNLIHDYFKDEKYFEFTLYDKEGREKKNVAVKGLENTEAFAKELNGLAFEYGDVVKVYHAESSRLHWYQKGLYVGEGKNKEIKELFFKITENGFERVKSLQEVTAKPQTVVVGTEVEKLEAKNFVEVKDGEVIGFVEKPTTTKIGKQTAKVETKDRFGNKQVTEVPVEVVYGDSIAYAGYGDDIASIVTLKHEEKRFHATDMDSEIHKYFNKELYMGITLYDGEGKEKKHVTAEGQETSKNFAKQVNGMQFEYGDVVKVFHAEPNRLKWYQNNNLTGQGEKKGAKELFFKVTEKGFERMDMLQEVTAKPQQVVVGTDVEKLDSKAFVEVKDGEVIGFVEKPNTTKIGEQKVKVETKDRFGNKKVTEVPLEVTYGDSIAYVGYNNDIASIVTLKHDDKKFHATDMDSQIHKYFNKELYMGMTLYDGEGKEKKHVTAEGQETSKDFAKQVNGMQFEYGDVVKVFHAEPDRLKWYQNNNLIGQGEKQGTKELFFKVTEKGFERMDMLQEVTAKPQTVVVGTEIEKLDAKNFVEVKGGEVVGFAEKPNTTKIGKQTVKVETKDRFGNKQITEVPVEVIYGDSIMFFGTWHDGTNIKSIVTLNHEEKKFSTTDSEGPMHTSFKDEKYMAMAVYDKDGQEKKEVTVKASENTKEFAAQFNGMAFEYGDIVKIYQKEFDRFKVYKKNEFIDAKYGVNEVFFKVTTQGFEQMGAQQEVKALPQKVVIGTNSETLDAKKFVEVKGGEVVGFVGMLDTSKISKQTAKVETKDRFGNKKVTEVPVEVTYGDSIVYQGVSNVTRSIVTLNHDEKKLHATFTNDTIHYRFVNEQYIGLTIYDGNGNEKKHVTAEGQETSKNFAEQVNGTPFQYGDTIKVYHAESDRLSWYKTGELLGKGDAKKFKEISFKITPNGLEQVQ